MCSDVASLQSEKSSEINFRTVENEIELTNGNLGKSSKIIDLKSFSVFHENILKKKFKVLKKDYPIYFLKAIKNKIEIQNMIKSHILDGVALTKFLHWIKIINKRKITEYEAQKKLESFM